MKIKLYKYINNKCKVMLKQVTQIQQTVKNQITICNRLNKVQQIGKYNILDNLHQFNF